MTGQQQAGDLIASRTQDHAASIRGVAVDLRVDRKPPPLSPETDLSNVIPFARVRRGPEPTAPAITITAEDRVVPPIRRVSPRRQMVLLVGSIALHSSLLISFFTVPKPMVSVGIEAINVEVELGANTAAGVATTQSENETQPAAPLEQVKSDEKMVEEKQVTELREVAQEEMQKEPPAELQTETQITTVEPLPEKTKQVEKPKAPAPKKMAQPTPSVASNAANGIGRGSSAANSNYRGLVAAHLARHKQYPSGARSNGTQGTGTVTFTIDGGGRVTAATIVKSTGATVLDQELTAMVRRSSPFPAPPGGQGLSFTVPVSFRLN